MDFLVLDVDPKTVHDAQSSQSSKLRGRFFDNRCTTYQTRDGPEPEACPPAIALHGTERRPASVLDAPAPLRLRGYLRRASVRQVREAAGGDLGDLGFLAAFVHLFTMLTVFNVLDLVALDWPMVLLQPRFIVLPGTEGMAGYRSYWLPFRGFLIGIPITLGMSLVLAAIAASVY